MCVCLDFWSLKTRFDCQGSLKEIQSCPHLSNASVIASHVVEGHCLTEFVVLAQFFRLLEKIKSTVNVLFFQIIDSKDVADFTQLLASASEFS